MSDDRPRASESGPRTPSASHSTIRREGWRATVLRFSRLWGFVLFAGLMLVLFREIVVPFVFGTLIAYLLIPLVRRLAPHIGRGFSVVLIYLGLFGLLSGFFGVLVPGVLAELGSLRDSTPATLTKIDEEWLPRINAWIDDATGGMLEPLPEAEPEPSEVVIHPQPDGSFKVDLSKAHLEVRESGGGWVIEAKPYEPKQGTAEILRELVAAKGDELTTAAGTLVRAVVGGIASFLTDLAIAFLLAAYILVDFDRIQRFIRSLIPIEHRHGFDELVLGLDQGMAGVVRGQLLICLINGALTCAGLLIFGVKHALLLALMAAVLSLVPIFGSLLSALPIMAVALVSNDIVSDLAFGKSLAILGWLIGIHLLEANWLNPKIIGTTAHIHPIVVVFALLAGYSVYGFTGALLAIPVVSMIQAVFQFSRRHSEEFVAARSDVFAIPHDLREVEGVQGSRPIDIDRAGDD
ncbi:AI-2E family transporter [Nannocystaceae bacterium ST9]